MCGIAGHAGPTPLAPERAAAALASLGHRGPDHAGRRSFETPAGRSVDLLHTRLSIIDLDPRANQPFADGPATLVCNGELYDYVELRRALEAGGERFETESDTEVLARMLRRSPDDAWDDLEGMWALALYDERDGSLRLSRDRFGEKPLYLLRDGEELYFASEVKALAALTGRPLALDREHLRRYLVNGYKSLYKDRHQFFRGVEELPRAHVLRVAADGAEEAAPYWRPDLRADEDMTYDEAVEGTRAGLRRSVDLRLRADVPLAFMLSGGIDSVSLISTAARELGRDVHGFTILNSDARYEEREMIELAVSELGVQHTSVPLETSEFLPRLRELVRAHDAPVMTISYYVHWLLMQEVADAGYRVAISGTGADELFSGYYDHHLAYLHDVRGDDALWTESKAAWERHVAPIVRNPFLQDPDYFITAPDSREHIYLDAERFSGYLTEPFTEPFAEERYVEHSLLRNRTLNELFHEAVPVILHEDDLNAMSHSIENRSPYLDRELFEHAVRIPSRHLVRDGRAKAVLRDAMRGVAPDAILDNRRKVGFNAPVLDLLDTSDAGVRGSLLEDSPVFELVRREAIEQLLDERELPNSLSKFLFYFTNAKLFMEEFDR